MPLLFYCRRKAGQREGAEGERRAQLSDERVRSTLIWDVTNIAAPTLESEFFSTETVSDHNQYVLENHVFQANYMAGLQVLRNDQHGLEGPVTLRKTGYFDVDTENGAGPPGAFACPSRFPS